MLQTVIKASGRIHAARIERKQEDGMRLIRVFPERTAMTPADDLAFIGEPPLFRPEADAVHVSGTFLWHRERCEHLAKQWERFYPGKVSVGGPAFGDPGGEFVPGRYLKRGITITSRGCCFNCDWCVVPKREGKIRLLTIRPGNVIQDNNLLACPRPHVEAVFDMLETQKGIRFSGGFDSRLLKPWHVERLARLSLKEMWFACDEDRRIEPLENAGAMLTEWDRRKKRCYVLVAFKGETIHRAEQRLMRVWKAGFLPFAQFYRGKGEQEKTIEWAKLVRLWSRPAAMFASAAVRQAANEAGAT